MFEYQKYLDQLRNRKKEIEGEVDAKNPFDSGVMRAVKSAKISLGLDTDQEHKAIRKGLFRFSDALTQQYGDPRFSKRKGAINNLASVAPAMAKGLEGYEDASDKIQHDNREVYEWAKKFRDAEVKRLRDLDQEAFDRYFADKKLGLEEAKIAEQRDYHKGMLDNKSGGFKEFNGQPYRALDKVEQRKANNEAEKIHQVKHELDTIENLYKNYLDITKKNLLPSFGGVAPIINYGKGVVGNVFGAEPLQKEIAARDLLFANLGKFRAHAERSLKGGVLGQGMYDRLTPYFPNENDIKNKSTFESKIAQLRKEVNESSEVADIRSKHGINYNFGDYKPKTENTDNVVTPESLLNTNNQKQEEYILMYDPETGEEEEVYYEDEPIAIEKGLIKR